MSVLRQDIWKAIKVGCFLVGVAHAFVASICCITGGGVVYVAGSEHIAAAEQATESTEALRVVIKSRR